MKYAQISPQVSALIDQFIPSYVRENFPELIQFVEAYFNYLEDYNKSVYYSNTLPNQRDLELQDEIFLREIEKELGLFIPRKFEADPKKFYYKIIELWRSKGSREAIETFFRLTLDDEIVVRFPWNNVLKPSDGRWVIERKLRVTMISGDGNDLLGQEIRQVNNLGIAQVTKIERKVYPNEVIFELSLEVDGIAGDFVDRDEIIVFGTDLRAEIYRSVIDLNVTESGTGYRIGDRIQLSQHEGATFTAYVSSVDEDGGILDIRMANFGAGNTPNHIKETNPENQRVFLEDYVVFSYITNAPVASGDNIFLIDTDEGSGADFEIVYGPIATTEGIYTGVRGQLSESIVLQDSDFYQKYSYEVISSFSINNWLPALKRSVHPAGVKAFSNVRLFNSLELNAVATQFTATSVPPNYFFGENVPATEYIELFDQDYAVNSDIYFVGSYVGFSFKSVAFVNDTSPDLPDEQLGLEPIITGEGGSGTNFYIDTGYVDEGYV